MKLPRGLLAVALVGLSAGCAATVDDARGRGGDAGVGRDALVAMDAGGARADAGAGCGRVIDVAREGEAVPGGYRVVVDDRGAPQWTTLRMDVESFEYLRRFRVLAFTAPEDGVYAFTVARSPGLEVAFRRLLRCDPPTAVPGLQPRNERLLDGVGQRHRLRRGEETLLAVGGGGVVVVSARRMNDRGAGEACTVHDACPAGLVCERGVCGPGGGVGAPCAAFDPPCGPGLFCAEEGPTDARCRLRITTDDSCGPERPCAEGLSCAYPLCVPAGTRGAPCGAMAPGGAVCAMGFFCARDGTCAPRIAPGAACGPQSECDVGVACVTIEDGVQRCAGPGDLGGACRDGATPCAEGLACEAPGRRCVLPLPRGAACRINDVRGCDDGQCDGRRCVAAGARGQRCRALGAARCDAGLACDQETCVVPLARGAGCDASARVPGCVDGACLGGVCVPRSGSVGEACRLEGAPCDEGARCVEGRCVARRSLGAACEGREPDECADGLACWPPSDGRCLHRNARSRACGPGGACAAGRACIEGECIARGVCDRMPSAFGPVRCDDDAYCVERDGALACVPAGGEGARCRTRGSPCDAGLLCSAWGICARDAMPVGACGVPWYDPCPESAFCVVEEGGRVRCAASGTRGGPCRMPLERADACDAGLVCDVASARCVAAAGDGPCSVDAGRSPGCSGGSTCVFEAPSQSRCVPDGTARGRCRPYAPRCDPGHRCDDALGWCVREVPEGQPCPGDSDARCATGLACLANATGTRRCERARTLGARCGAPGPFDNGCDAGLACFDGRCVTGVPESGRCDLRDATKQCAAGLVCVAEPDGERCRVAGAEGRRCAGLECRPGLACVDGSCLRTVEVGEACAPATSGGPICRSARCNEGRCTRYGALGGRCGADGDCAWDLVCRRDVVVNGVSDSHCAPRPSGDRPCDGSIAFRCESTATCVNARCVPDGSMGGLCRVAATPRCDGTLRCDPATARCAP